MSSQTNACGICKEEYTHIEERRPVIITVCGHTYCRSCLNNVDAKQMNKFCPSCKSDWSHLRSRELPVCFQLLPQVKQQNDIVPISSNSEDHESEADKLARIKETLEQQEKELSAQLLSVNSGHGETIDRIRCFDNFNRDVSGYQKSLESHKSNLEELKKQLENQLEVIREKLHAPKQYDENKVSLMGSVVKEDLLNGRVELPTFPDCRILPLVEVYEACKTEPYEETFKTTFKRNLVERWQSRTKQQNASSNDTSVDVPLYDEGNWVLDCDRQGSRAIFVLTYTSSRPRSVTISVNKPWNRLTLLTLLSTIASKNCSVTLHFEDTFQNPSPENNAITLERLNCLDVSSRRCSLMEYKGSIDSEVEKILPKMKTNGRNPYAKVWCLVTSADDITAVNKVKASSYVLQIPKGTDTSILGAIPNTGSYELRLHGRGDQDLYEVATLLQRLTLRNISRSIHFLESTITEGGLDRFLGHMRDEGFNMLQFTIQSKVLDQNQQQEISSRLQGWREGSFITWNNN